MNSFSPVADGFRHICRRPAIFLGEVAWRWSFAAAAGFLVPLFLIEYLDTLPVTGLDRLLLASSQPVLVLRALRRILQGSAFRFTGAGLLLMIGLAVAWIILASFGRIATVNFLADQMLLTSSQARRGSLRSLAALNCLRCVLALAAITGMLGSVLLASSFWASTHVRATEAARLCALVLLLVWIAWTILNWLLSTAASLGVAEGNDALDAIASVLGLLQRQTGPILAVGFLFGIVHVGVFVAALGMGFSVLVGGRILGTGPTVLLEFAVVAGYCALADFLYISRVASYLSILKREEEIGVEPGASGREVIVSGSAARIDPDELILSDVPVPAT